MTLTPFTCAVEHFESGDYENALQQFAALVEGTSDPREKAGFLLDQANCYAQLGDDKEAHRCLELANQFAGDDPMNRLIGELERTCLQVERGQLQDALSALTDLLERNKTTLKRAEFVGLRRELQMQKGVVLFQLARYDGALPDLVAICEEYPDDESLLYLGRCYHELGRYAAAAQSFSRAIELGVSDESRAAFHYYFGRTYYELGEFAKAKQQFMLSAQNGEPSAPHRQVEKMLEATCRLLAGHENAALYAARGGD
jgi:tetratricopeptide (TPR) repeat protein